MLHCYWIQFGIVNQKSENEKSHGRKLLAIALNVPKKLEILQLGK